jgi:hypothetical protein
VRSGGAGRHHSRRSLIPFIRSESDTSIIATATIDCCMLTTRWNNDPLTAPKAVARQLDEVAISPTERLGILTGLLLLGDDRVLPLVKGRWQQIESVDDRRRLATIEPVAVSTLAIDFLLDWLEQTTDPEDILAISTTMARMPRRSPGGVVWRRCSDVPGHGQAGHLHRGPVDVPGVP